MGQKSWPFFGIAVIALIFMTYTLDIRREFYGNYEDKKQQPEKDFEVKKIILVTTARSGSSWTGRFLSQLENSFYLYEPLNHKEFKQSVLQLTPSSTFIQQLFECGLTAEVAGFVRRWSNMYVQRKCKNYDCINSQDMTAHCLTANYRIFKVIRMRLGELERLLNLKSFSNLKIIFLTRDLRGTLSSYKVMRDIYFWPNTDAQLCSKVRDDAHTYAQLSPLYPNNFFFLRVEDISRNSLEKASELYNFIHDTADEEIPESWRDLLMKQIKKDIPKKALKPWESWRDRIELSTYDNYQELCRDVNDILGYHSFESYDQMKNNHNISSLKKFNCNSIPCK